MGAMSLDFARLGAAIVAARKARGWSQQDLADASGVSLSTVQNFEAARRFRRVPTTLKQIEAALEWETGSGLEIAQGGEPRLLKTATPRVGPHDADTIEMSTLDLDDPVIKELLSSSFAREEMRWELIRLYLADVEELAARARRRAAIRALRRASGEAVGGGPGVAKLLRLLEVEDTSQDSDDAGQERSTA